MIKPFVAPEKSCIYSDATGCIVGDVGNKF